jgi:hypothetical protein
MNKEQAKHVAGTLRAIAFAQFATYGYVAFQQEIYSGVIISALLFVWLEVLSFLSLRRFNNE